MKKIIIITAIMTLFTTAVRAQVVDTLPFNIGLPWYYSDYSLDSLRSCDHDSVHCYPMLGSPAVNIYTGDTGAFLGSLNNGNVAYGFFPDSTLHVVGIASVSPFFSYDSIHYMESNAHGNVRTVLDIINNTNGTYNQIRFRLYKPDGEAMQLLKSVTLDTFDTNRFSVYDYCRGVDFSRIPEFEEYSHFNNRQIPLVLSVYFDEAVDISDSLYISCHLRLSSQPSYDVYLYEDNTNSYYEAHIPNTYGHLTYPVMRYRQQPEKGADSDPWDFGVLHRIPLVFPIIRRDCDSCPPVHGVEVLRSGAQVFLEWQQGTNHVGWQVAYGPAGTPPEECTVLGEYSQATSGLVSVDPDSQYVAYVRARCRFERDEWGEWSAPATIWINVPQGIGDIVQPDVTLSPNPAHGTVTVDSPSPLVGIEVYDPQGRKVISLPAEGSAATVDISALPHAVYTMVITTANCTATRRLSVE